MEKKNQVDSSLPRQIDELPQRCHVAGKEIDLTRLPDSRDEWQICTEGCQTLSDCKKVMDA
jgi:hypothetical protein